MGELCITCKHFIKIEVEGKINHVCKLHLEQTSPDDYCSCWESEEA